MTRVSTRLLVAIASAMSVAALGGCTAPTEQEKVTPSAGDTPWVGTTAPGDSDDPLIVKYGPSPLSAYNGSREESESLMNAEGVIIALCMADRGFSYETGHMALVQDASPIWNTYLGVTDPAQAKAHGYLRETTQAQRDRVADAEAEADANTNLSPEDAAYMVALYGPRDAAILQGKNPGALSASDDDGCLNQADKELTPTGPVPNLSIQADLGEAARAVAQASPEVQIALSRWSACMTEHGYPLTAIPLTSTDATTTPDSVAQAVQDVACKESSGITDAYITALYAAERTQIDSHQAELEAFSTYYGDRVRLAAAVLSRS